MAKRDSIKRKWYILDAKGKVLGRLATEAARILRGKHKPEFTPHVDTGDHVLIINAKDVVLTGKKLEHKQHIWHSNYPGGLKQMAYKKIMAERPEMAVRLAVEGMLPHNRLGRQMARKLKVYRDETHPHEAQKPELWIFGEDEKGVEANG